MFTLAQIKMVVLQAAAAVSIHKEFRMEVFNANTMEDLKELLQLDDLAVFTEKHVRPTEAQVAAIAALA